MPTLHIYTRVSTVAQEDRGTSLASQEEIGRSKAASLGFDAKVWNEGGKSSNHEELSGRPVLQALVNEIQSGHVKHIFVYDQSRLSRNDQVASLIRYQCRKHGVTLYTKDGTYDFANPQDAFMKQVLDALAELDNVTRAERTRLGKLQRVRQQHWHGGPPPFGYKLKDKKLALDETEAPKVKDIFNRYAAGDTTQSIKRYLDKSGVGPRRGGAWNVGSIQKLLTNTHYIGYYRYRDKKSGEELSVACPPIVSKTAWVSAQEIRKARLERRGQVNRTKRFYLLRDLMYCGHCGTPLGARTRESKNERFYYCPSKERRWRKGDQSSSKHSKTTGCGFSRSMNIEQADKLVWDTVIDVHSHSSLLKEEVKRELLGDLVAPEGGYSARVRKDEKTIRSLERDLKRADDALADAEADYRLGNIEAKLYPSIRKRMEEERTLLEARIEALKDGVRNLSAERRWVDWVKTFGDEIKLKGRLSDEQKKAYLKGMIDRIDVRYLDDSREHELVITFSKPVVGDGIVRKRGGGYSLKEGASSRLAHLPTRGSAVKRHPPVGNDSVTVE